MQSWVNKEYRMRLSMHPCGTTLMRINIVEVLFPTFTTWGQLDRAGFRLRVHCNGNCIVYGFIEVGLGFQLRWR
jgi:hypothetical protein